MNRGFVCIPRNQLPDHPRPRRHGNNRSGGHNHRRRLDNSRLSHNHGCRLLNNYGCGLLNNHGRRLSDNDRLLNNHRRRRRRRRRRHSATQKRGSHASGDATRNRVATMMVMTVVVAVGGHRSNHGHGGDKCDDDLLHVCLSLSVTCCLQDARHSREGHLTRPPRFSSNKTALDEVLGNLNRVQGGAAQQLVS